MVKVTVVEPLPLPTPPKTVHIEMDLPTAIALKGLLNRRPVNDERLNAVNLAFYNAGIYEFYTKL